MRSALVGSLVADPNSNSVVRADVEGMQILCHGQQLRLEETPTDLVVPPNDVKNEMAQPIAIDAALNPGLPEFITERFIWKG